MTERTTIRKIQIPSNDRSFLLVLEKEDYTATYPGMFRYVLSVSEKGTVRARFVTNSYEYAPQSALDVQKIARVRAERWEERLRTDPEGFFSSHPLPPPRVAHYTATDVVVIQGSPRGEGNSSIFAGWAADAARNTEKSSQVLYPNDMDIHHCIGCYQCYNTGYCIYDDDMGTIIAALNNASLVVVCSPVYTMTVPSGLKALIDRCQAYHAQRLLASDESTRKGLLLSVAGRKGMSNFSCLQGTIHAYMRNLGMKPEEDILIDGMDEVRDIRNVAGVKERVEAAVTGAISGKSGLL